MMFDRSRSACQIVKDVLNKGTTKIRLEISVLDVQKNSLFSLLRGVQWLEEAGSAGSSLTSSWGYLRKSAYRFVSP